MANKEIWLVVDDGYDFYQPKIVAFTTQEKAMQYLKNVVVNTLGDEFSDEDEDNMAHDYGNGKIYVTSADINA